MKIESWNFQQLFDLGFHETLQSFSSFRQTFSRGNKSCLKKLKSCEVLRNNKSKRCWKFQISILTNKKILSVPCTMNSSFFSQQMVPWHPNFPHQRLCFLRLGESKISKIFLWIKGPAAYFSHLWSWSPRNGPQ